MPLPPVLKVRFAIESKWVTHDMHIAQGSTTPSIALFLCGHAWFISNQRNRLIKRMI
jgi:hypothetical protein